MKTNLFILLLAVLFIGCSSSDVDDEYSELKKKYSKSNPCDDSLYSVLKIQPLDSLSDREYQYMRDKEKDCNEYAMFKQKQKTYESDVESANSTRTFWIGAVIVSSILSVVLLIINFK